MTAFSNALYYPTIDITNSSWLKTAVLFWDSIFTIVPESFRNPYQNSDAVYLFRGRCLVLGYACRILGVREVETDSTVSVFCDVGYRLTHKQFAVCVGIV